MNFAKRDAEVVRENHKILILIESLQLSWMQILTAID